MSVKSEFLFPKQFEGSWLEKRGEGRNRTTTSTSDKSLRQPLEQIQVKLPLTRRLLAHTCTSHPLEILLEYFLERLGQRA